MSQIATVGVTELTNEIQYPPSVKVDCRRTQQTPIPDCDKEDASTSIEDVVADTILLIYTISSGPRIVRRSCCETNHKKNER